MEGKWQCGQNGNRQATTRNVRTKRAAITPDRRKWANGNKGNKRATRVTRGAARAERVELQEESNPTQSRARYVIQSVITRQRGAVTKAAWGGNCVGNCTNNGVRGARYA